jgi:hypothetical protein
MKLDSERLNDMYLDRAASIHLGDLQNKLAKAKDIKVYIICIKQ